MLDSQLADTFRRMDTSPLLHKVEHRYKHEHNSREARGNSVRNCDPTSLVITVTNTYQLREVLILFSFSQR